MMRPEHAALSAGPILDLKDVSIRYGGVVLAVEGVDLDIGPGEVLGVIGESGSGKSTLAHAVLGLLPKGTEIRGRRFTLQDTDLLGAGETELATLRGPAAAMIFQNPMTAFSPIHTLGQQLVQLLWRDRSTSQAAKRQAIIAMLERVGIPDPAAKLSLYPFQFSGGMLQRVAIAAALLMRPALLVADEPTTALDVTMEAQILHLMREMNRAFGVSILMISHHLGVIAEICDRVAVMYAGRIVEQGPVGAIFAAPRHPYTQALMACEPALVEPGHGLLPVIAGEVARPGTPGCGFAARCPHTVDACRAAVPGWTFGSDPLHGARCIRSGP